MSSLPLGGKRDISIVIKSSNKQIKTNKMCPAFTQCGAQVRKRIQSNHKPVTETVGMAPVSQRSPDSAKSPKN